MIVDTHVEPLVAGDHLSRDEFIHRWNAQPELKRAELIGGIVYMPSPLSAGHGRQDVKTHWWLVHYALHTPGCEAGSNATWYMLKDVPQPDAHLRVLRECGGSSWEEGEFFHGAPELIVEVSLSSTSYDLHQKKDLYRAAGVREYVVVLVRGPKILWHRLVGEHYQELQVDPEGIIRSISFPGLWLEVTAFLEGDTRRLLAALQRGLDSPDHTEFVDLLASRRKQVTSQ